MPAHDAVPAHTPGGEAFDLLVALESLPVATWVLDAQAERIVAVGETALRVVSRDARSYVGRPPSCVVVPEQAEAFARWIADWRTRGPAPSALDVPWRIDGAGRLPAMRFALIPARHAGRPVLGLAAVEIPNPGELQTTYVAAHDRYEQLFSHLPLVVWTVDEASRFTWVAGGIMESAEVTSKLIGRTISEFLGGAPGARVAVEAHRIAATEGRASWYDYEREGTIYETWISPLEDTAGRLVGAIGVCLDATQRRRDERELRASREELRDLARRIQSLREEEQTRIAREIHDQIGGTISLLRVELARLQRRMGRRSAEERGIVDGLLATAADLLTSVRRVAAELRPPVLENVRDLGLPALLEYLAADLERRSGLPIHLDLELDAAAVDPARAETTYHVVREALHNVIAHAGAASAVVSARIEDGVLEVHVMDDGRGLPDAEAANPRALGLLGIRERIRTLGGTVGIRAQTGAGTTIDVRLPLESASRKSPAP